MNNSSELNEIFKALSLFQGELENASKNVDKEGINWKYADLAGCINTAKPHLLKHGLAVTQFMGMSVNGKQSLNTMLTHSSGQYISDETELPDAVLHGSSGKNPVQVLGSAITYIRRYNYAAIIGMAQEDDDGVSANGIKTKVNKVKLLSDKQVTIIRGMLNEITTEGVVCGQIGVNNLEEMHATTFNNCIEWINGQV